jgi:hypothetical protein
MSLHSGWAVLVQRWVGPERIETPPVAAVGPLGVSIHVGERDQAPVELELEVECRHPCMELMALGLSAKNQMAKLNGKDEKESRWHVELLITALPRLPATSFHLSTSSSASEAREMTEAEPMKHCVLWPARCVEAVFRRHINGLKRPLAPEDFLDFGFEQALGEYYAQNSAIVCLQSEQ